MAIGPHDKEWLEAFGPRVISATGLPRELVDALTKGSDLLSVLPFKEVPADTLTGRMAGITDVKNVLHNLRLKKEEQARALLIAEREEDARREAEREAIAESHYLDVGFGSWG